MANKTAEHRARPRGVFTVRVCVCGFFKKLILGDHLWSSVLNSVHPFHPVIYSLRPPLRLVPRAAPRRRHNTKTVLTVSGDGDAGSPRSYHKRFPAQPGGESASLLIMVLEGFAVGKHLYNLYLNMAIDAAGGITIVEFPRTK